jgi:hypothetical protein
MEAAGLQPGLECAVMLAYLSRRKSIKVDRMAKIKSTLDLVMERTKNISITQEERDALHKKEWTEKAMSWVQRVLDRKMTLTELKSSLRNDEKSYPDIRGILKDELIAHIDPDEDNTSVFEALREVLDVDVKPYENLIGGYHERLAAGYAENLERAKSALKGKGISGTAVVPNLAGDETWAAACRQLKAELRDKFKGI